MYGSRTFPPRYPRPRLNLNRQASGFRKPGLDSNTKYPATANRDKWGASIPLGSYNKIEARNCPRLPGESYIHWATIPIFCVNFYHRRSDRSVSQLTRELRRPENCHAFGINSGNWFTVRPYFCSLTSNFFGSTVNRLLSAPSGRDPFPPELSPFFFIRPFRIPRNGY